MSTNEAHPDTRDAQSDRQYHRVPRAEFERGLAEIGEQVGIEFENIEYDWSSENIYEAVVNPDYEDGELFVRVYSSLYRDDARDKGKDAIRTVLLYRNDDATASPVAVPDTEYTMRLPTWQSNLAPDVKQVVTAAEKDDLRRCDDCGDLLSRREKEGTKIWGCLNYPNCTNTEPADGNPACPECSNAMILRENSNDGSKFWGCIDFPDCRECRQAE